MKIIVDSLHAVLNVPPTQTISEDTRLGELPGWDSMNAINLQMEIEARVGRQDLPLKLSDRTTVRELVQQLKALDIAV